MTTPTNPPKIGAITLKAYISVLKEASKKPLPNLHIIIEQEERYRIIKELLDAGLLSDAKDASFAPHVFVSDIILTPQGAFALI